MDGTNEKTCLLEISSLIFDSLEKVTLKTISNSWMVTNAIAQQVLNKWLIQNEKKVKELVKMFLVQGTNSKGKFIISVVDEETLKRLEDKWKDLKANLYSVETKSNSRSLDLPPRYESIKVKNILINPGQRDIILPQTVKKELVDTTKIKTPFGMVKPAVKKEEEKKVQDDKKVVEAVKPISPEKVSPPINKPSTSKAAAKKDAKPAKQGNISSFFEKQLAAKTFKVQPKKEEDEPGTSEIPEKMDIDEEEPPSKRSVSPAKIKKVTTKKPPPKKPKLKTPQNKKRSRIQVMEDSSDDDEADDRKTDDDERDSKIIKFDREETPEVKERSKSPTPEKPTEQVMSIKRKAKRYVTKRFETADGFIRTEKVLEEYSASEGENEENRKKNSPPAKAIPAKKTPPTKKPIATAKPKDTVKTKQGSITNFFNKK